MIKLQNPNIPPPTAAIEIDKAIHKLQLKLDTKISWLSHSYGRAYRHIEKNNKLLYFPEVYIGGNQNSYYRVTPDNDKSGMCFFVVGKENNDDFDQFHRNYLNWDVGIVFNVNLKLINSALLSNEIFTQNLIRDIRDVLTMHLGGIGFNLKIKDVVTEFREIYKEFNLEETQEYLRAPMQAFRFNCNINLQEECGNLTYDPCEALKKNLSKDEKNQCILPTIDFSEAFQYLTNDQYSYLQNQFGMAIGETGTRIPAPVPVIEGQTPWLELTGNVTPAVGSISKTSGANGYNTNGIFAIATLGDFEVEFRLSLESSAGVSNNQAGIGYVDIDFSIYKAVEGANCTFMVYEKGQDKGTFVVVGDGDPLFKIKRNGWFIEYYANGVLYKTSYLLFTNPGTNGFMLFDTALYSVGNSVSDIVLNYL